MISFFLCGHHVSSTDSAVNYFNRNERKEAQVKAQSGSIFKLMAALSSLSKNSTIKIYAELHQYIFYTICG